MKKNVTAARIHDLEPVDSELAELGEECARVLLLLQRLAKARAQGKDCNEILGELSASVLHLHAHTRGLDEQIDDLASD
ncbi:MAG: hypothetical protein ABSA52_07575 [Candidatus Binatia bacterium]|jgi:hypothetical protein